MGIGEENANLKIKAQEEYKHVLDEYMIKFDKRYAELESKGIQFHLDGEDLFKDIGEWYKDKIKEIKEKYLGE